MARYLLSVMGRQDHTAFGGYDSEEEMREGMAETGAFNARLAERGVLVFVDGLEAPATATVVDGRGSAPILTDGPFIESKEGLNGLWIIEVPDLDEALTIAQEASRACRELVEVRPFARDW
ncbi:YciI family protein [Microbacterium rhizophilus]|uniref:YciI family protein n=1 Tax=Microbacterium rhizophilus TaxID=3138934 RepID=UPI0031E78419